MFSSACYYIYNRNAAKVSEIVEEALIQRIFYEYEPQVENHIQTILLDLKEEQREFIGYLEFPRFNIRRLIQLGTDDKTLETSIGQLINGANLDDEFGNLIFAGHNRAEQFAFVFNLNLGDEIILNSKINSYKYVVTEIYIVPKYKTDILKNIISDNIIRLITCTNNNQDRLIIEARRITI